MLLERGIQAGLQFFFALLLVGLSVALIFLQILIRGVR